MIQNASFQRKVIYLGLIAVLLLPLYVIGHPSTKDPTNPQHTAGGTLAQLRHEHDLAIAELGEIDPASESMKLATLGMRGVAANILWTKANYYKKTEDWEKLVATVNQMSKLQPNFVSVWEFQSHNLSYNISAEHDDYRFRYLWVKKGIEFLIRGTHYNRNEPKIYWNVGWYTGQKFGRADEHRQFRQLYPDDNDFHEIISQYVPLDTDARGADNRPDNWLTAGLWYTRAYDIVETRRAPIRGKTPHIFYADGPKSRMNYATAIASEGYLDEHLQYAWRRAGEEWNTYGNRLMPTSFGTSLRLNDQEAVEEEAQELVDELHELLPGVKETIYQEKVAKLPAEEQELLARDWSTVTSPTDGQRKLLAHQKTEVSLAEVADRAPEDVRARALRVSKLALAKQTEAYRIHSYRENVNFVYWRTRCEVEQLPATVKARAHVYDARQALRDARIEDAKQEFEGAWQEWAGILEGNPDLVDRFTEEDLYEDIKIYMTLLGQLDEEMPEDFKLQAILDRFDNQQDMFARPGGMPIPRGGEIPGMPRSQQPATDPGAADSGDADTPSADTTSSPDPPSASEPSAAEPPAPEPPAPEPPAPEPAPEPPAPDAD